MSVCISPTVQKKLTKEKGNHAVFLQTFYWLDLNRTKDSSTLGKNMANFKRFQII